MLRASHTHDNVPTDQTDYCSDNFVWKLFSCCSFFLLFFNHAIVGPPRLLSETFQEWPMDDSMHTHHIIDCLTDIAVQRMHFSGIHWCNGLRRMNVTPSTELQYRTQYVENSFKAGVCCFRTSHNMHTELDNNENQKWQMQHHHGPWTCGPPTHCPAKWNIAEINKFLSENS